MSNRPTIAILCLTNVLLAGGACQPKYGQYQPATRPLTVTNLSNPQPMAPLDAIVVPPVGWQPDEIKQDDRHAHQVWKSPSGDTAYGIIHFSMPLPVPASWVKPNYLAEMKRSEGEATEVGPTLEDQSLPGLRFTVDCGDYRMRTNLVCKGFRGWAIYVGTLRNRPENPAEIAVAEQARDQTTTGVENAPASPAPATPAKVIGPAAQASE